MDTTILSALIQLIVSGQLTGVTPDLAFNGTSLMNAMDEQIDNPDKIIWRPDGFSAQQSPWAGRMCKDVEERREKETDAAAALALPQYFVQVPLIDAETSDQAAFVARQNNDYLHMIRGWIYGGGNIAAIRKMCEYSAPAYQKGTTIPEWRPLPMYMVDPILRGSKRGDFIGNHRIVIGNHKSDPAWTAKQIGEWAGEWLADHKAGLLSAAGAEVL